MRPKLKKQIVDFLKQHEGSAFDSGEIGSGCGIIAPSVLPVEESYWAGERVVERVLECFLDTKIWSRPDFFTNLENEWEGIYLKQNDRGSYLYYSSSEELKKERHECAKKENAKIAEGYGNKINKIINFLKNNEGKAFTAKEIKKNFLLERRLKIFPILKKLVTYYIFLPKIPTIISTIL
ncbi:MAG: hypothetical protein GQ533_09650 [Methanosarcinaceae archaeon]|nr:hypothetical protein [Methanosarcinaceae archaeon]